MYRVSMDKLTNGYLYIYIYIYSLASNKLQHNTLSELPMQSRMTLPPDDDAS